MQQARDLVPPVYAGLPAATIGSAEALKINVPKHGCFEYRIAAPQIDVADAVQDTLQDDGIIR